MSVLLTTAPDLAGQGVDILTHNLRRGDATSEHVFALTRVLRDRDMRVNVYSHYPVGPLPADMQACARQVHPADFVPCRPLTILEYPLWYPLAERFREAPHAAIFWYHGVTEPALVSAASGRDLLRNAQVRTELAHQAHLAVAASPFAADELQRNSGYPSTRIRVVPLGVPLADFSGPRNAAEAETLRARWGLNDRRVLLYVGRVAEHKRIDLLIDALAHLMVHGTEMHPDLHLLVVGDAADAVQTRALAARLTDHAIERGVGDRVTLTGRVDSVVPYYGLGDVYVQASLHEGFCVPLVEAMAAGLPVVAGASGAIPWVLDALDADHPAGLLCRPGDAVDLARQIGRLLVDDGLVANLRARGAARAQKFGLDRFGERVLTVVAEAFAHARERRSTSQQGHLHAAGNVARHDYRVRSRLPLVGRLIEWARVNATSHLKEAYLDRIVLQQENFNHAAATELEGLRQELAGLRRQAEAATRARERNPS